MNTYKSKFEKRTAKQLSDAKVKFKYEYKTFKYTSKVRTAARCSACGSRDIIINRNYTPDFFLDSGIIIETKGRWTTADRYKMLEVRTQNPTLDLRMLFMSDNKISKQSKTRYSDWCSTNDIPYALGKVPDSWLNRSIK